MHNEIIESPLSSYWKVLRIVIVAYFLFLMGDAFYRWDGFKFYATFSEFIPSIALISILWSILAVCTTFLIWGFLVTIKWLAHRIGINVLFDHLLMLIVFFILLGAIAWQSKALISSHYAITTQTRIIVLTITTLAAFLLTYIFRNKEERWMRIIQDRITPLVWLFTAVIILSTPLVIYHTWVKGAEEDTSQKVASTTAEVRTQPNILLVTFDALTSRDMSSYGYHRPTTPFIDTWAKGASLFKRLEAESVITTPTTASLMTGKRLWTHQTIHLKGSKPDKAAEENLALLLKNNGYTNMAFIANGYAAINVLGIEDSFDIAPIPSQFTGALSLFGSVEKQLHYLFGEKIKLHDWLFQDDFIFYRLVQKFSKDEHLTKTPPEKVFRKFLWSIENNSARPYFAWVHLYPPHDPYLPPPPFIGMFNDSPDLRSYKTQYKVKKIAERSKDTFKDFPPDVKPDIALLRERYDEFIVYCDSQFENFISYMTKNDKLDNTIIILSSDHGESFEHGAIQHSGRHLFEQIVHIPLIIKEPGQKKGLIINDLAEQIDIPATILDLVGIQVPSWMEGRSLLPLMRGKSLPEQPIFSMTMMNNPSNEKITTGTFAVWEGDYKLIHYLENDRSLLFDLRKDPDESINLIENKPDISQRMLGLIKKNLDTANENIMRKNKQLETQ